MPNMINEQLSDLHLIKYIPRDALRRLVTTTIRVRPLRNNRQSLIRVRGRRGVRRGRGEHGAVDGRRIGVDTVAMVRRGLRRRRRRHVACGGGEGGGGPDLVGAHLGGTPAQAAANAAEHRGAAPSEELVLLLVLLRRRRCWRGGGRGGEEGAALLLAVALRLRAHGRLIDGLGLVAGGEGRARGGYPARQ